MIRDHPPGEIERGLAAEIFEPRNEPPAFVVGRPGSAEHRADGRPAVRDADPVAEVTTGAEDDEEDSGRP